MYDFDWHRRHGAKTSHSADRALAIIAGIAPFGSVLDIGCGDGRWLEAAGRAGATHLVGVDGPWTEADRLRVPKEAVHVQDLNEPVRLDRRFDLAMSLEVAEHVEVANAEGFVDNLTTHADHVLFGAAIPFQGGFRHLNERWPSYWRALFEARGYRCFDPLRAALWPDDEVHFWYKQNVLVYVSEDAKDLIERYEAHEASAGSAALPTDIVHPDHYEAIASYSQIAFKPLLRQLPKRSARKISTILRRKA